MVCSQCRHAPSIWAGNDTIDLLGIMSPRSQIAHYRITSKLGEGLCTLFLRHTSASLVVQENADPSARTDLERWLNRLVPEDDALYTHRTEGADDMPAHIKAALTAVSLSIPIHESALVLGIWQGIYLWEHRRRGGTREVVVHIGP